MEEEPSYYTFDIPFNMLPLQISGLRTGYYELNSCFSGWHGDENIIIGYKESDDAKEFVEATSKAILSTNKWPLPKNDLSTPESVAIIALNEERKYQDLNNPNIIVLNGKYSIFEVKKQARKLIRENNVSAIIIDDITMLTTEGMKFIDDEIFGNVISRTIHELVRELYIIPIVSLVPYTLEYQKPRLTDINSCLNVERDADAVVFLIREEDGKLNPIVTKNRGGRISGYVVDARLGDSDIDDTVQF